MAKQKQDPRYIISIDKDGVHFSKTIHVHQNAQHNQVQYSAKNMFSVNNPELTKKLLDIVKKKKAYIIKQKEMKKLKRKIRGIPISQRGQIIKSWNEIRRLKKKKT